MQLYARIKKYLILLTLSFIGMTSMHLLLLYLYEGAKIESEKGWTLTIGIIGGSLGLNPLQYLADWGNDFLLPFLYRSLIRFDWKVWDLTWDLANCDLSNYAEIRCKLNEGVWNTGEKITEDDILATYAFFAETQANKQISKALSKVALSSERGAIVFRTSVPSSEILPLLMIPIMKKEVTEKLRTESLKWDDTRYSWQYRFEKRENGNEFEKITLSRNEWIDGPLWYSHIIIKIFSDAQKLTAAADSINLIYPNRSITTPPSSVFEERSFTTPNFVGVFANTKRLPIELRKIFLSLAALSWNIEKRTNITPINNPFFTAASIFWTTASGISLQWELEKMGYFQKDALIKSITSNSTPSSPSPSKKNIYITTPSSSPEIVLVSTDEIAIEWWVPPGTESVEISGYTLKWFTKGDTSFLYRARKSLNNLKSGTNTFSVVFKKSWSETSRESITIHLVSNEEEKRKKESELLSTVETIPTSNNLSSLDPRWYYKKDGSPFILNLRSLNVSPDISTSATQIKEVFEKSWIQVQIESIDPNMENLSETKKWESKNYDLLITGIHLGYLWTYLFPHFHSGQSEDGLNFAQLQDLELDILLEELRSKQITREKKTSLESRILSLLSRDAVLAPLYAPRSLFYIDKNIKNFPEVQFLPNSPAIFSLLQDSYINEKRIISWWEKSFTNFLFWLETHTMKVFDLR